MISWTLLALSKNTKQLFCNDVHAVYLSLLQKYLIRFHRKESSCLKWPELKSLPNADNNWLKQVTCEFWPVRRTNGRPCCPPMSNPLTPTDCTAWRFWTMRQRNVCSTPAPKSSPAKQWVKELAQTKEEEDLWVLQPMLLISGASKILKNKEKWKSAFSLSASPQTTHRLRNTVAKRIGFHDDTVANSFSSEVIWIVCNHRNKKLKQLSLPTNSKLNSYSLISAALLLCRRRR